MEDHKNSGRRLVLEPWEVGGELLDILSRGLYSDSKDAIREYTQNGVDAKATKVIVTVDGPRLVIRDNGLGMDWNTLRRARRFGISDKSSADSVGFRGIGIYSAFGMCESLTIRTRQAEMEKLVSVQFDFGSMRRILEQDRSAKYRAGIALADLLHEHCLFDESPYPSDRLQDHFTVVEMLGIGQEYRAQMSHLSSLQYYLLNTLPVAFPNKGYGPYVNQWLSDHVGINPVRIVLRIGNEPETEVSPEIVEGVEDAQCAWIRNSAKEKIAFVWHVLSNKGSRLPLPQGTDENSGTSGFLLRLKGFTLGGRGTLKTLWPPQGGRTLYHHHSGEVHIVENAAVYPNAARDDLEPSRAQQLLLKELGTYFDTLNQRADLTREIKKAQRRMQGVHKTLNRLNQSISQDDASPYETYRQSQNFVDLLDKAEKDLPKLKRGRKANVATPSQVQLLGNVITEIQDARRSAKKISNLAERRLQGKRSLSKQEIPPQYAVLERAKMSLEAMVSRETSPSFSEAFRSLDSAVQIHSILKAIAVLDGLKANGVQFTDEVEASRKELRTLQGWSATGPVSLEEALSEAGFSPISKREQALIEAIGKGLLIGLGGRGQSYEAVLRSVAQSVSEEDRLQFE